MKNEDRYPVTPEIHADPRGLLCAIEQEKDVPFPIHRVFFISQAPADAVRGNHAYKHNEYVVCVSGGCRIKVETAASVREYRLQAPFESVLIPADTWRELCDFTPDCILAVLSDAPYNESDYITDRSAFLSGGEII